MSDAPDRVDRARVVNAGLFSYITYGWVFAYLWSVFRKRPVSHTDAQWQLSLLDAAGANVTRLEIMWRQELIQGRRPSLFRVVMRFFRTRLMIASTVFAFCLAFGFIGPVCARSVHVILCRCVSFGR